MNKLLQLLICLSVSFSLSAQTISEIHYNNVGGDVGEFVEVIIPADGCSYFIVFYNGSNGNTYATTASVTCTAPTLDVCGTAAPGCVIAIPQAGIQNGAPDGMALVQNCGGIMTLIEFLSYQGSFTGNNGIANGIASTDIGTAESGSTPIGYSIAIANGVGAPPAPATPGACPDVPLSIELLAFTTRLQGESVRFDWSTNSELNNDYFEVQHSVDGRSFETIEKMAGTGTTTTATSYNYSYEEAQAGTHYYRLKQVDFDGTATYSQINEIFVTRKNPVSIAPTLVDQDITINVAEALSTDAQVNIFDATGQMVIEAIVSKNETNKTLNVAELNTGTYFIIINTNGQLHSTKFMKL